MATELGKAMLLAPHPGRLKDEGSSSPEQISLGKLSNGITTEYPVIRHLLNLESVLTYEEASAGRPPTGGGCGQ